MQNKEMFAGIRVLELASVLAGPSVGQFFAELGAEVIKVENPQGGDVTRSWKSASEKTDDRSAYFSCCNWGKKSVTLDLRNADDRAITNRLLSWADVVVASYKPGDATRLGVDYESVTVINPTIIYGEITGYGENDERVGYDAVIQAEAGFMSMNGEPDGAPLKMPVALVDVLAAHHLKEGLLLALLNRERNGKGSKVSVSLMDAALSSLANQGSNYLVGGVVPGRQGSAHPNIAPYGDSFATRDGLRVLLAVGNDRQYQDLLEVLGVESHHLLRGAAFQSNADRVRKRAELNKALSQLISQVASGDLVHALRENKVPAGLISTVREAVEQLPTYMSLQADGLLGIATVAAKFSGGNHTNLLPPPHLGEHNEEIRHRFGG